MDLDLLNRTVVSVFGETTAVQCLDAARDLHGIFDSRHFEVDASGEVPASELVTSLAVAEDPDDPVAMGERLIAHGITYRVKDRCPDGQGMSVLELERT